LARSSAIEHGHHPAATAKPGGDMDVAVLTTSPLDMERRIQLIADIASATGRPVDLIDLTTVCEPLLGQILH